MDSEITDKLKDYLDIHETVRNLSINNPRLYRQIYDNKGMIYYLDIIFHNTNYSDVVAHSQKLLDRYWTEDRIVKELESIISIRQNPLELREETERLYKNINYKGFEFLLDLIIRKNKDMILIVEEYQNEILNLKQILKNNYLDENSESPIKRKDQFKRKLDTIYTEYGYLPNSIKIKQLNPSIYNLLGRFGGFKNIAKEFNYVTEDEIVSLFAYMIDEKKKIKCTVCGSDHIIKYGDSRDKSKYNQGYKCKKCNKRFNSRNIAKNNFEKILNTIRSENNLSDNTLLLFYKSDKNMVWNFNTNRPIFAYKYETPNKKTKKFIWTLDLFKRKLDSIYNEYGYMPKYIILEKEYDLASAFIKFGGYKKIVKQFRYITQKEIEDNPNIVNSIKH
ncbi:IS1 family transposase [Alkaliphilus sp. B6464]|uniref:IS1 family transposase n=1 Tax=Alkaliphilus sp. B6464 TaxID=2731219 RepID=UPI001BA6F2B0|nr:IS1 family transposase [Alkaliphilus sp. B6464]QUH21734.1 IS1 family transposase [Alkaliphilus sp. B6464]